MKYQDFDTILDALKSSPDGKEVELEFIDPPNVFKGPAILTVKSPDGKIQTIKALKGQNLRRTLLDNKIAVYSDKAKFTNCGGGGNCGTCGVLVTDDQDWEMRSDVEALRLKKYPKTARLSCFTEIEGDCTITVNPPKIEVI